MYLQVLDQGVDGHSSIRPTASGSGARKVGAFTGNSREIPGSDDKWQCLLYLPNSNGRRHHNIIRNGLNIAKNFLGTKMDKNGHFWACRAFSMQFLCCGEKNRGIFFAAYPPPKFSLFIEPPTPILWVTPYPNALKSTPYPNFFVTPEANLGPRGDLWI